MSAPPPGIDADRLLDVATDAMDAVIESTDTHPTPLFSSILDRTSGTIPDELPPAIEGQRTQDRAYPGSNLLHDVPLLRAMFALDAAADSGAVDLEADYASAPRRYVEYFALRCTDTPTGLFPWGEHAFRNVEEGRPGSGAALKPSWGSEHVIHDHLRQVPRWLWELLEAANPDCVQDFADGLDYHWKLDTPAGIEYNRHAYVLTTKRSANAGGSRSDDFPRHGGYYVLDWAFAYIREPRERVFRAINRMSDYWWEKADPEERGLLPVESRGDSYHSGVLSPGQTSQLAVSSLDAARLLADDAPRLAGRLRERGETYAEGFLAAPHRPAEGRLVTSLPRGDPRVLPEDSTRGPGVSVRTAADGDGVKTTSAWGSGYGGRGTSTPYGTAVTCLRLYRHTDDERFLDLATGVGDTLFGASFPEGESIRASDPADAIDLLAALHAITGEGHWLEAGLSLAGEVVPAYFDATLPRGATTVDHYEAQLGSGSLIAALTRLALRDVAGEDSPMPHADLVDDTVDR